MGNDDQNRLVGLLEIEERVGDRFGGRHVEIPRRLVGQEQIG
jgi:hypothetical protein